MTPQQADSIVNRAIVGMVEDPSFDADTIAMVAAHLRATLAPLVTIETEDET